MDSLKNAATRGLEYYRAVGKQHPQEGMTPEQSGASFLEQKHQENTIGSKFIGSFLNSTGLGAQKMAENARKDAEEVEDGYRYAEKLNGKSKSNNLHSYDSFQHSQDFQPEHKIVSRKEMAAMMRGSKMA